MSDVREDLAGRRDAGRVVRHGNAERVETSAGGAAGRGDDVVGRVVRHGNAGRVETFGGYRRRGLDTLAAVASSYSTGGEAGDGTSASSYSTGDGDSDGAAARLRELADEGARLFPGEAPAEEVVAWAAATFGRRAAVACSMAADTVLAHLVSTHIPQVDTLFLDTGYHFPETLGLRAELPLVMPVNVVDVLPAQSVAEQDAEYGPKLHDRDPALCCRLRKVEPLARELRGYDAWFTGVRRDEAPTRANTPLVSFDERHGLVKINPLAYWSFDDVIDYTERHNVPVNPLLAEGYPSIGCAPCTAKPAPGEDPRAGRWAGLTKTECGIHL